MAWRNLGGIRTRTIVIQVAIVTAVILWLTLGPPKIRKEQAAAELARRGNEPRGKGQVSGARCQVLGGTNRC